MQLRIKETIKGRDHSAAGRARRIFYVLMALCVAMFAAFYLVGYRHPWLEDPNFNAPILTGCIIGFMLLMLVAGLAIMVWAVVRGIRLRTPSDSSSNGIPVGRIACATAIATTALLLLGFLFGSSAPMWINGHRYQDTLWLKAADMFVVASLLLILVAVVCVAIGYAKTFSRNK